MTRSEMVPPWLFALTAMASVQLGSALSVGLIDTLGAAGTAWLRLGFGALIFLAIARPKVRTITKQNAGSLLLLGVMTGLMTMMFLAAIQRIPLGMAVSIEFLGPLTVAALRSDNRRAMVWPGLALIGVFLLTQAWQGEANLAGIGFALLSGVGWGSYIVLTQHVGDRFSGTESLSITVTIAACTAGILGIPQAAGHLSPEILLKALGLAILLPVLPFAFELLALRRMNPTAFGTLMALEPAIGVMLGLIILHQQPTLVQVIGVTLVVIAGSAAQRNSARQESPDSTLNYETVIPG